MQKLKFSCSTKSLSNEQGSSSFLLLFNLLIISTIIIHILEVSLDTHEAIKKQHEQFLCFKDYTLSKLKYLKRMSYFNKSIQALYIAKVTPGPQQIKSEFLWESTLVAQSTFHAISLMKYSSKKIKCDKTLSLIRHIHLPYGLKLSRFYDGRAKVKEKKWQEKEIVEISNTTIKDITLLKTNYSLKGRFFTPSAFIEIKEVSPLWNF